MDFYRTCTQGKFLPRVRLFCADVRGDSIIMRYNFSRFWRVLEQSHQLNCRNQNTFLSGLTYEKQKSCQNDNQIFLLVFIEHCKRTFSYHNEKRRKVIHFSPVSGEHSGNGTKLLHEKEEKNLPCQNSFPFPESSPETGRKHVKTLLILNHESG